MSKETLPTWNRESGYIYAMLGSAVGFGNLLSFSGFCYRNGGGAFLIPYIIICIVLGIPLLLLEGFLGKETRLPIVSCYRKIKGDQWSFFGWMSVLACLTVGAFYIVISGYSSAYAFYSAFGSIGDQSQYFFKEKFLYQSDSFWEIKGFAYHIFFWVLMIAIVTWWILGKNIQNGLEKVCSFFLPLLYTLLVLFVLLVFVLPGSVSGVFKLINPDFSRLLDPLLWRDVMGQVFFSLSLGMGIVTGLSRFTTHETHLPRAMLLVTLGNLAVSVLASVAIFGCLGFLADSNGVSLDDFIHIDSVYELGFVIFPKIMHTLGGELSQFIGFVFFLCLFIAGATGVFSIVEAITGNFIVEFNMKRKKALAVVIALLVLLSIPFCMGNGLFLLQSLEPMLMGDIMLFGGIAEIVIFLYLSHEINQHRIWVSSARYKFSHMMLKSIALTGLITALGGAIAVEIKSGFAQPEALRFGWFFIACLVAFYLSMLRKQSVLE